MVKVTLRGGFYDNYRAVTSGDSELADLIADKIHLFEKNPDDTRLKNHAFNS